MTPTTRFTNTYLMSLKLIATLTLVLVGIGSVCTRSKVWGHMVEPSQNQSIPVSRLLQQLGGDYDRFFTIEEAWNQGETMNALESRLVQRTLKKKGLQLELGQLRSSVPNFNYQIDLVNPRLIHIIDARLADQKGYALNSVINRIDFSGPVTDLAKAIGNQGIPIASQTTLVIGDSQDSATVVHVKGEKLKVRDALSNSIPLDKNGRILWIATTKLGQGEITRILYPWRGSKPQ